MEINKETEYQEKEDKRKEYSEICTNMNVFSEEEVQNSERLFTQITREETFNEEDVNNYKFEDEDSKEASEILNKFKTEFFEKVEKIYDTSDLIIKI